jgi:ubiquinone/menaquinone biosynthesis C-methylase UbiE
MKKKVIYDEAYAKSWIENYETSNDVFRVKYLEPFLKKQIDSLPSTASILDVGCGWGTLVKFLKSSHHYYGIDPVPYFFKYIKTKFKNKNIILKKGNLPSSVGGDNKKFDFVVCSMVLHTTPFLKKSIKTIFSKINDKGQLLIIDFNNSSEKVLREEIYNPIIEQDNSHVKGISTLPSGVEVLSETYFHKEDEIEKIIKQLGGKFKKKKLGSLFVSYLIVKENKK